MNTLKPIPTNPIRHRQHRWLWFVCGTVLLILIVPWLPLPYRSTEVLIASMGGLWGLAFFLQNGHKEDAKFMRELFEYFNDRYNAQNNALQSLLKKKGDFDDKEKLVFIDYFNFSAEEWVFKELGYVYDSIWEAWENGMRQYGKDERVKALWAEEKKSKSYYGFEFPTE